MGGGWEMTGNKSEIQSYFPPKYQSFGFSLEKRKELCHLYYLRRGGKMQRREG